MKGSQAKGQAETRPGPKHGQGIFYSLRVYIHIDQSQLYHLKVVSPVEACRELHGHRQ